MVSQWNEKDFYLATDGSYYLYPKAKEDNYFERRARKMFWLRTQEEKG